MAISTAKWEYSNTSAPKINEFHVRWVEMHWVKIGYHTLQMCIAFFGFNFSIESILQQFSFFRLAFEHNFRGKEYKDREMKRARGYGVEHLKVANRKRKKKLITAVTTTKSTRYFFAPLFRVFLFPFEFSERDCCYWEKCIHANIQKQKLKLNKKKSIHIERELWSADVIKWKRKWQVQ